MFSFFCVRQISKGGKSVCLDEGRKGVTILGAYSKNIVAEGARLSLKLLIRMHARGHGESLMVDLLGKEALR